MATVYTLSIDLFTCLLFVLGCLLVKPSNGHGFMTQPRARNVIQNPNHWQQDSGDGWGPAPYLPKGNPGICGDPYKNVAPRTNFINNRTATQATYAQGSTITIKLHITMNHGGRHQFAVCPYGSTQDCFFNPRNMLTRADRPGAKYYWTGLTGYNSATGQWTAQSHTWQWTLPPAVNCPNGCFLQWRWYTVDACTLPCEAGDDPTYHKDQWGREWWWMGYCKPNGTLDAEIFQNCADVVITPASTPSPSPAPSQQLRISQYASSSIPGSLAVNSYADSASAQVRVPFTFRFGGVDYGNGANGGIHFNSNSYITFGAASTAAAGLGPSNPTARTVFVGAADVSWQRLYVEDRVAAEQRLRVRYEGYSSKSAKAFVDVVWEASFYRNNTLMIWVGGTHAMVGVSGAVSGVGNGAGRWLGQFNLAVNTMYVVDGLA